MAGYLINSNGSQRKYSLRNILRDEHFIVRITVLPTPEKNRECCLLLHLAGKKMFRVDFASKDVCMKVLDEVEFFAGIAVFWFGTNTCAGFIQSSFE